MKWGRGRNAIYYFDLWSAESDKSYLSNTKFNNRLTRWGCGNNLYISLNYNLLICSQGDILSACTHQKKRPCIVVYWVCITVELDSHLHDHECLLHHKDAVSLAALDSQQHQLYISVSSPTVRGIDSLDFLWPLNPDTLESMLVSTQSATSKLTECTSYALTWYWHNEHAYAVQPGTWHVVALGT